MKRPIDLSATQKKLIAESLCQIAVNLASASRPVPSTVLTAARESLVRELLALNVPFTDERPQ